MLCASHIHYKSSVSLTFTATPFWPACYGCTGTSCSLCTAIVNIPNTSTSSTGYISTFLLLSTKQLSATRKETDQYSFKIVCFFLTSAWETVERFFFHITFMLFSFVMSLFLFSRFQFIHNSFSTSSSASDLYCSSATTRFLPSTVQTNVG